MKRYIKVLLVMLLFITISVKADYTPSGVIPSYTTVFKGDTIDLKLGNEFEWDESMVVSNFNEDTNDYDLVKTADNTYLVEPIFIVVDSDVFELNIDENKLVDSNYIFTDYKKTTYKDKNVYEFDFELKKVREDSPYYEGGINQILLSGLKLKTNENADIGTYYIEVLRSTDFYEDYEDDSHVITRLPISVISEDSNEKSFYLKTISTGLIDEKEYKFDISEKNYELLFFGEIESSNLICNKRCLVNGIGTSTYTKIDTHELTKIDKIEYSIKYEDGTKDSLTITNKRNKATIDNDWADNFSKSIIIVGEGEQDYNDLFKNIASKIDSFEGGFEKYYYDYSKLNDVDKEILSNLNESFTELNEPYIYVIDDGKIVYENHGIPKDEEINKIQEKIDENNRAKNNNTSNMSTCSGDVCNISSNDKLDLMTFISENYMVVVIGLSVIVILLILLITIVKKSKNHEETF